MKETKTFDSGLTQYEMKKNLYSEVAPLDALLVTSNIKEISEKMINSSSRYYMLLCNDRRDYTVFALDECSMAQKLKTELQETIQNRGEIIDMYDGCQDNSWEIWIRDNGKCFCYILFEYDSGVIEI